ncbi:MAG: glycosyltransferase family 4 protein [Deltaproteobacteria bacterium]|nr:glycosyltransferase family 4 protein [Deltaproteobacteria bacterium]
MSVKRVAFVWGELGWMGGINYFRNLFRFVSEQKDSNIRLVLITGKKSDCYGLDQYAEVIQTKLVERMSFPWLVKNLSKRAFGGRDLLIYRFLDKHRIDLVSHYGYFWPGSQIPTLPWIPDFQHLRLPQLFEGKDLKKRNKEFSSICENATGIVLSSEDALKDLKDFYRLKLPKTYVLRFISGLTIKEGTLPEQNELKKRYGLNRDWFYVPNQFWAHKNHAVIIQAMKILKGEGADFSVVATGATEDYRNPEYFPSIIQQLKDEGLEKNIHILGLVPYEDVLALMRYSVAVINPSLFEGWSTTVEEAKSLGKKILLSNIGVHQEQAPERGLYFEPHDSSRLAFLMKKTMGEHDHSKEEKFFVASQGEIPGKGALFAREYERIVMDVLS